MLVITTIAQQVLATLAAHAWATSAPSPLVADLLADAFFHVPPSPVAKRRKGSPSAEDARELLVPTTKGVLPAANALLLHDAALEALLRRRAPVVCGAAYRSAPALFDALVKRERLPRATRATLQVWWPLERGTSPDLQDFLSNPRAGPCGQRDIAQFGVHWALCARGGRGQWWGTGLRRWRAEAVAEAEAEVSACSAGAGAGAGAEEETGAGPRAGAGAGATALGLRFPARLAAPPPPLPRYPHVATLYYR